MPTPDHEVAAILNELSAPDPRRRTLMLGVLVDAPSGRAELVARLQELLADIEVTVLGLPFLVGEVRWVAAHALAAEYQASAVERSVLLTDVPEPLNAEKLLELARSHHLRVDGDLGGLLTAYVNLRVRNLLVRGDLRL